jgi:plasmid stabilization system protein ParE
MLSERGRLVPGLEGSRIREILVRRYRLMYIVDESELRVVAFVHSARDFPTWRREQALEL